MTDDPALAGLLSGIGHSVDELAATIVRCFQAEMPAYAPLPREQLEPGVRSNIQRAVDALERGWEPTAAEIAASRALGEERAHQGVPLEALLRAHRIGVREVLARVQSDARAARVGADVVLDLSTRAWAWADAVMLSAAAGHRDVELTLAGQERQQRSHLMRGLLAGNWAELARSGTAAAYGIVAEQRYVLALARGPAQAMGRFESRLGTVSERAGIGLLSAEVDNDLALLLAAEPTAAEQVLDEAGGDRLEEITVAVGDRSPVAELARSHEVTRLVLQAAMSTARTGLVSLADVPLLTAILARPEVGRILGARYIEPLEAYGDFGAELLKTLRSWLDHGCRIDDTAAALFVHPNTMRHRLRRVEALLGIELSATATRVELWWALTSRAVVA